MIDKFKTFYLKNKSSFELLFAGDTSFGENYQESIKKNGGENILERYGYEYSLKMLKPLMQSADFIIANLETPVTDLKQSPFEGQKDYIHWSDPEKTPKTLVEHHVSLVNLANNHTFDYGMPGFEQTLKVLQDYHMPIIGAGSNITEAGEPFMGKIDFGTKQFAFAVIAAFEKIPNYDKKYHVYSDEHNPGLMPLDVESIAAQVKKIKTENPDCFVILLPHWGGNYHWCNDSQIKLSDALISCGVDLIIGAGAHMIQECERRHDKWVIYNMGNFVFNSPGRYEKMHAPPYSFAPVLSIQLQGQQFDLTLKLYPILSDNLQTHYQPRVLTESEFAEFYKMYQPKIRINGAKLPLYEPKKDSLGCYLEIKNIDLPKPVSPQKSQWIGMIYYEKTNRGNDHIYPYMVRARAMEDTLSRHNAHLVCYSVENVDMNRKRVTGKILKDGKFVTETLDLPLVNYDFYISSGHATQEQIERYQTFERWTMDNGYIICPPRTLRRLASDKLKTAEVISKCDPTLIIPAEKYRNEVSQIKHYLRKNHEVYIKPRYGNLGNNIFRIKEEGNAYDIEFYRVSNVIAERCKTLDSCLAFIKKHASDEHYIIQEAVDIYTFQGLVYSVRMILYHDGIAWRFSRDILMGKSDSHLSNEHQGGFSFQFDEIMPRIFPEPMAAVMIKTIEEKSIQIVRFLEQEGYGPINDLALDFLIDKNKSIYLVEMNVKPGLVVHTKTFQTEAQLAQTDHLYYRDTFNHGKQLAESLLGMLHRRLDKRDYWFGDIVTPLLLSEKQSECLMQRLYRALDSSDFRITDLPEMFDYDDRPRIVFLTVSDFLSSARVFFGSGAGILEAVNAALQNARELPVTFEFGGLKLDVVQSVLSIDNHALKKPFLFDRSLFGLAFDETLHLAFTPELLVKYSIVNDNIKLNATNILRHFNLSDTQKNQLQTMTLFNGYAFATESYYYSHAKTIPLFRGHRFYPHIDTDLLLSRAIHAGNYLQASVKDNGVFDYEYLPKIDSVTERYNILRHAGTVYAMFELFELTHNEALLASAKRALSYLLNQTKRLPSEFQNTECIVFNDKIKLGANALAVLAICKYTGATLDRRYVDTAKKLGLWIKSTQNDAGEFTVHKQRFSTREMYPLISDYYPGEALFSLVRLYEINPDTIWLESAIKAADYIINVRDKNKSLVEIDHDHWLLYGLNALYRLHPHFDYIKHSYKICQAIMLSQNLEKTPPDYYGSFYIPPRSTPVAIRAEGLCAAYHLLYDNGYENEAMAVCETIKRCIQFQLQTQFTHERTLYLSNTQRALGGFSKSLTDYSIRIDYVQHNLSSLLGLYKILKTQYGLSIK